MSSRSIEGENPLYLPQAKTYDGSCSLGPGIILNEGLPLTELPIHLKIEREGEAVFTGAANTNQMKRSPQELADWLMREVNFPNGVLLMTGTCLVPEDNFTLKGGDQLTVGVGDLVLENRVAI